MHLIPDGRFSKLPLDLFILLQLLLFHFDGLVHIEEDVGIEDLVLELIDQQGVVHGLRRKLVEDGLSLNSTVLAKT